MLCINNGYLFSSKWSDLNWGRKMTTPSITSWYLCMIFFFSWYIVIEIFIVSFCVLKQKLNKNDTERSICLIKKFSSTQLQAKNYLWSDLNSFKTLLLVYNWRSLQTQLKRWYIYKTSGGKKSLSSLLKYNNLVALIRLLYAKTCSAKYFFID